MNEGIKFSNLLRLKWNKDRRRFEFGLGESGPRHAPRWEPCGEKQHRAWRKAMRRWKREHIGRPLPPSDVQRTLTEQEQIMMRGYDPHLEAYLAAL